MIEKINGYPQIQPAGQPQRAAGAAQPPVQPVEDFAALLNNERIKFSQHAQSRMAARNLNLTAQEVAKVADAVDKAAVKGSRESLLLMENMALVVSVKNRTVITAVDNENLKENVFTNIDSAMIVK